MKVSISSKLSIVFIMFLLLLGGIVYGQYREYMVVGKITDHNDQPLAKVSLFVEDTDSSRSYKFKTNKKGAFKFAGLPHAIYSVIVEKEGFESKTLEWKLETPQHKMKRVEIPTIVLVSTEVIKKAKMGKKLQADFKKAKQKVGNQQYDEAITILEEMLKQKPDEPTILFLYGECLLQKKNYEKANTVFAKVVELNPAFIGGFFKLGVTYQRQNMLEKALENYKKNLEIEPKNYACIYNTGMILYSLNRHKDSIPFFQKALEIRKDDVEILEMMALCYIQQEDYATGEKYLEKAVGVCKDETKLKSLQILLDELKKQTKK